jgi:perosamine synthetase
MIPYGRQSINEADIKALTKVLKSGWLTTGPYVKKFEVAFAKYVGAKYAVAVCNGTAALHVAYMALGLKPNDEIITTPMTFCATSNAALYCGAKPVFADIKGDGSGLIDCNEIKRCISDKTRIMAPVHFAGQSCDMEEIHSIAKKSGIAVVEDASHALGAKYKDSTIGDCKYSDIAIFSLHPVKHITTGEGGIATTNSKELYEKMLILRSHGLVKENNAFINKSDGPWYHEMQYLGYNYRITDIQCALGLSQLNRVNTFIAKRRKIASKYNTAFNNDRNIAASKQLNYGESSYHLYVVRVNDKKRLGLFNHLVASGINCQIHYIPVYLHPYYAKLGYKRGSCPNAEKFYGEIISIPIYPDLTDYEQKKVIENINSYFKK